MLRLWEVAARQAHPFLEDEFFLRQRYDIPNAFIPNSETHVLTINDLVVGFICVAKSEVAALFVDPVYQNRGVGRALLDFAQEKHGRLTLEVFEANLKARAFYHAYGFREYGSRLHEEAGENLLCLALDAKG